MTHYTPTPSDILTSTLSRVEAERLLRGVEGLTRGEYAITLTRNTCEEISAFVAKEDGTHYSVVLTALKAFCGCRDAMFRGTTCKHSVALALFVMRTPPVELQQDEPQGEDILPPPNLKLAKVRRSN